MLPMLPRKVLPLFLLFLFSNQSLADAYADAREDMMAAYQTRDFPAMQVAANNALQARPGYPGALFNLAFAKTLNDDPAGASRPFDRDRVKRHLRAQPVGRHDRSSPAQKAL